MSDRPETGALEFEGDWRGVFVQGQDALMHYAAQCDEVIGDMCEADLGRGSDGEVVIMRAIDLLADIRDLMLTADHHRTDVEPQRIKSWIACVGTMSPQEHIEGLRAYYTSVLRTLEAQGAVYAVDGCLAGQKQDVRRYRHAQRVMAWVERIEEEVERG